jgi:hypothetical protein
MKQKEYQKELKLKQKVFETQQKAQDKITKKYL